MHGGSPAAATNQACPKEGIFLASTDFWPEAADGADRAGLGEWGTVVVEGVASPRILDLAQDWRCDVVVPDNHERQAADLLPFSCVCRHALAAAPSEVLASDAQTP